MSNEELWKKNHENKEKGENDMCKGGKVGRKFPQLTNSYDEDQIEKKKEKNERKRENKGKNKKERKKEKKKEGRKSKKKKKEFGWDKIRPKEKRNKKGKRRKAKKEKKSDRGKANGERERNGREKKMEIFQTFRRLELDRPRRNVDPHIASYARVPKSWSFVKLHEVGNFPTRIIFNLKAI